MTFGGLDALFNPAKQHMEEEKLRLQSTREEVGDASGGKRIDLDSGRVRLGRAAVDEFATDEPATDELPAGDPGPDGSADVQADTGPGRKAERGTSGETQAARRARERRSKTAS